MLAAQPRAGGKGADRDHPHPGGQGAGVWIEIIRGEII